MNNKDLVSRSNQYWSNFFPGAFLIPYCIMLAIMGIPVFLLELAVGQRLRKGAIGMSNIVSLWVTSMKSTMFQLISGAWNLVSGYMGGLGIAAAIVSFNVALYYNTIIAWCIFYFFNSFKSPLPWSDCPTRNFPNGTYVNITECVVCPRMIANFQLDGPSRPLITKCSRSTEKLANPVLLVSRDSERLARHQSSGYV